jgi:hypothetical protein
VDTDCAYPLTLDLSKHRAENQEKLVYRLIALQYMKIAKQNKNQVAYYSYVLKDDPKQVNGKQWYHLSNNGSREVDE